jgi:hypothetical protein
MLSRFQINKGAEMYKSFNSPVDGNMFDKHPFKFTHNLVNHPALSIESLSKTLPELPPYQIMYSKGLDNLGINFDRAHIDHKNGLSLKETIETLRTCNSYIAIKNPEVHPTFKELFQDLTDDVSKLMKLQNGKKKVIKPLLWMFIASPNAMTPFHFDRASNFLMQIRGSKEVSVFPPMNEAVVSAAECEAYIDRCDQKILWEDEKEQYAIKFDIRPGEILHIPFVSGHYVKNGPDDVSITLSYFFHNDYTHKTTKALQMNHRLRSRMKKIGLTPTSVGRSPMLDLRCSIQ